LVYNFKVNYDINNYKKNKTEILCNFIFIITFAFLKIFKKERKGIKMFAIVDIAGQQFKVEKNQEIFVNRLKDKEGTKIELKNILLIEDDNGKTLVGTPFIGDAKISAKIITHLKADKIIVFKKIRRKRFQKSNGHRQPLSKILIEHIFEKQDNAKKTDAKAKENTIKDENTDKQTKKIIKPSVKTTIKAVKPSVKATAKPSVKKVVKTTAKKTTKTEKSK